MSRFAFAENAVRVQNLENENSTLLAYFNFMDTETGLQYRDFRLTQLADGRVFCTAPAGKPFEVEGRDKPIYPEYVRAAWDEETEDWNELGKAWFDTLAEEVMEVYNELNDGAPKKAKGKKAAKPAKKAAGRGRIGDSPRVPTKRTPF